MEPESRVPAEFQNPHNTQKYLDVLKKFYMDIYRSINDPLCFSGQLLAVNFITFDQHFKNCESTDKDSIRHTLLKTVHLKVKQNPECLLTFVDRVLKPNCDSNDSLCQDILKEMKY